MNFYRRWIDKKELEGFKIHADIKDPHPFEWGLEHIGLDPQSGQPYKEIQEYNSKNLQDSYSYFVPQRLASEQYTLMGDVLSFPSPVRTAELPNNTAYCRYFPTKNSKSIIIVVPHWNAAAHKYDRICQRLNKVHFASIRITLPYHGERGTAGKNGSVKMVSADIGLTLQAMRECVQDIITTVTWLEHQGYESIGIMGASIGSCAAFLAAAHDQRIKGFFANLMASYFGDVVWTGLSTRHIRRSVDGHITREGLQNVWLLNSPISLLKQQKLYNPKLKQFLMIARYDTTFLYELSEQIVRAYQKERIPFQHAILPCGHYSLGKYWFKLIDGYHIVRFFRNVFANQAR